MLDRARVSTAQDEDLRYISTRGESPPLSFNEAMLEGLARDGGLATPERYPSLSQETIAGFSGQPYAAVAEAVIGPFTGDAVAPDLLRSMLRESYAAFRHPAVAPLRQIGDNLFLLELFHGPTLAFKDVAMQLLARMMSHALGAKAERATILGATSGDTGAAAIEAFRGLPNIDVVILYPHQRVSDTQRRQMTTASDANIHVVAVEGSFDDCQSLLKAMFNNHAFRDEFRLSGVNSINIARVVAQIVYFFTSAVALGSPHRAVSFTVPTGNFGDVLAGYMAKRMGLPVERLVVATNENDILARALASGAYEVGAVKPTSSPSMDIQVSSNFERLLFHACGHDAAAVRAMMANLTQSGRFTIPPAALAAIRDEFDAFRTGETGCAREMARVHAECGLLIDPHSAVAVHAARKALAAAPGTPMIALCTAHPAKFDDAVEAATGVRAPLPAHLAHLMQGEERFAVLPNDAQAIERFIRQKVRR